MTSEQNDSSLTEAPLKGDVWTDEEKRLFAENLGRAMAEGMKKCVSVLYSQLPKSALVEGAHGRAENQ